MRGEQITSPSSQNDFVLLDLISLEELQEIQDSFAETFDVYSLITDIHGEPITEPSNINKVCQIIRSTPEGLKRCRKSDMVLGSMAADNLRPAYQKCLSCGFIDASAPIIVKDKHIANWQISHKSIGVNRERLIEYSKIIGVQADLLLDVFEDNENATTEEFLKALDFLWIIASNISHRGYSNLQLTKQLEFQKSFEKALKESEQKYRMLFNRMKSPFAIMEVICSQQIQFYDGYILEVNPSFEDLTGLHANALEGRTITEIFPLTYAIFQDLISKVSNSAQPEKFEIYVPDIGKYLEGMFFIPWNNYLAVIFSDITDRKISEEKIARNEKRLDLLVSQIPAIIWTTDQELYINSIEGSALSVIGLEGNRQSNITLDNFFQGSKTKADVTQKHKEVLKSQNSEFELFWKDHFFSCRLEPLFDTEQIVTGVIGICYDTTEIKEAEIQLNAYQNDLRSLTRELSLAEERVRRKIATLLHDDVGHNLVALKRDIQKAMKNNKMTDVSNEPLYHSLAQVNKIIQSTRELTFELSSPVLYDLGLIAAIDNLGEEIFNPLNICFNIYGLEKCIVIDQDVEVLLFQMIRELFYNVIKHADADMVTLYSGVENNNLWLSVVDNGKGFHDEKIFSEKKGFGLFSIRERLKYYRGSLHVKSTIGKGTRAILTIPVENCQEWDGNKNNDY